MTYIPGYVAEACQPYPRPKWDPNFEHQLTTGDLDLRRSQWLNQVVDNLSPQQLRNMVKTFASLEPQWFQQRLQMDWVPRRG